MVEYLRYIICNIILYSDGGPECVLIINTVFRNLSFKDLCVFSLCGKKEKQTVCSFFQPFRNFKLKLTSEVVKLTEKLGNKCITDSIKHPV